MTHPYPAVFHAERSAIGWRTVQLLCSLLFLSACRAESLVTWHAGSGNYEVNSEGHFAAISRVGSGRNLVASGQPAPVLQLRINGKWQVPQRAHWESTSNHLRLEFVSAVADIAVTEKASHLVLDLVDVHSQEPVEIALWGPYPTIISETIGEIVGVVRDRRDAFGIQALNPKTLGGYPDNENDIDGEFGADDTGYYPNLPAELKKGQGFRADTARPTPFGSVLQAYCRRRDQVRYLSNWGHEHYRVLPYPDGGLIGSRIALFVCPEPDALSTIGRIETAEGLPHPLIDGEWGKVSRGATASYLIVDFGVDTIDRAIQMTRRAGLRYLYHSSPFATWGHFQLKPSLFPNGLIDFQKCVDKARRAGIEVGFHTLSNFITPNDPYVDPLPNPGLAEIGQSELASDIDPATHEIPVAEGALFVRKSALNTVRIGNELIRFGSTSTNGPTRLLDCQRGAWGTRATSHLRQAPVGRLLDHDYQVFLADAPLSQEIARNIANLCNQTGARQLSFDGLEGNWSTGYGQYGRTLFTRAWYDALSPAVQGQVINDASNPGHFNWHVFTRMNWGEPWYAGFRESQTLYRFKNQVLFERNYMPHMLGWFALRPDTSIEDAEWLLARAAGFDAGFALATSLASTAQLTADPNSAATLQQFGATPGILASIADWESARMAGAFPPDTRALLRDGRREFHLHSSGTNHWLLQEASIERFVGGGTSAQPMEFQFSHTNQARPLQWTIQSTNAIPISGVVLELDGLRVIDAPSVEIPAGGSIKFTGGNEATVFDAAWKRLASMPVARGSELIQPGIHRLRIGATLPTDGNLKVEVRTLGGEQQLHRQ